MDPDRVTRRDAMKAGALAVWPLVAASAAAADRKPEPQGALTIGIATAGFGNYTNRQVAEEVVQQGVRTVQLFFTQSDSRYWRYNDRADLSDLTPARCQAIADAYRSAGVSIHSLGVYTNLIHPDESERNANLAYFEAMMKVARAMGVGSLITEAGHYRPKKSAAPPDFDFREEVWKCMVATGKQLAQMAERHQATVLFEPSYRSFLASAKRTRLFLEDVGSPRVRALLDPANLLELNDLEEMFEQLTPWIDCLHGKDYKLHTSRGVPAGQGDLDYRKFVALAVKHTPKAPMVLEYVGPKDYKQALAHLRNAMRQAGVAER